MQNSHHRSDMLFFQAVNCAPALGQTDLKRNHLELKMFHTFLGGGFKCFLFSPLLGEDSHFE